MNHFWEMSSTRKCRSDEGSGTLRRDNYFFVFLSLLIAVYRTRLFLPTYLPIGVITVAISYSTHCNNFIAAPREFAKQPGGRGGLACRKTIVVTVTVISNGVEIAITTGTYVGYTVYVRTVRMYRRRYLAWTYLSITQERARRNITVTSCTCFFFQNSRWLYCWSAYVGIYVNMQIFNVLLCNSVEFFVVFTFEFVFFDVRKFYF